LDSHSRFGHCETPKSHRTIIVNCKVRLKLNPLCLSIEVIQLKSKLRQRAITLLDKLNAVGKTFGNSTWPWHLTSGSARFQDTESLRKIFPRDKKCETKVKALKPWFLLCDCWH